MQYIQTDLAPEQVSEILISIGLEVESMDLYQTIKGGLKGFVIGEIKSCSKHPNADKLSITKVDIGREQLLDIVCGASNVATGQKVVVATVGTTIYKENESFEIKKAKIRGEVSEGMICAEDEIGIGDSHNGILVLPAHAETGIPASTYFKIENDVVFEIGLTPNRIDAASHYGVARDLAAYLSKNIVTRAIKPSVDSFRIVNNLLPISVVIENKEACKRYSGISISGVHIKESPEWLKNRLKAIGLKPINNVVDVTNFVLHETGQPLHAFDADKISGGKVIIKTLPEGTSFITLDGVERKLASADLMICNESDGMCIAGVFGGLESGVSGSTKNIFLESAWFNPVWIRRTAKRHGLNTDASFRFERGTDPNMTVYALKRAALLIAELSGGSISSELVDAYPEPVKDFQVVISFSHVERLIGMNIGKDLIKKILLGLEIKIEKESGDSLELHIPAYRVDVQREADVIEEILRLYGYDHVDISDKMISTITFSQKPEKNKIINNISDLLSSCGFNEIMSNSLTKSVYYDSSETIKDKLVYIMNPLSSDLNCMRQTLLFGCMEAVLYNTNRQNSNLKFYEFGNCYGLDKKNSSSNSLDKYYESEHLALLITGSKEESNWSTPDSHSSFYYLKAYVNNVLKRLGLNEDTMLISEIKNEYFDEGLVYGLNKKQIVEFGLVNSKLGKNFDRNEEIFYADFNWDHVMTAIANNKIKFEELPRFPEVRRDLSLIIDDSLRFEQLKSIIVKTERKLLKRIDLFDVYKGSSIEQGKKSYAISFILQDEKTLTDKEIDKIMGNIALSLEKELGARIR